MNIHELFARLKPSFIRNKRNLPAFYDTENHVSMLFPEDGLDMINKYLSEIEREPKYPISVFDLQSGNEFGIPEGRYTQTNFTPDELRQSQMLMDAHCTIITYILTYRGDITTGQILHVVGSGFQSEEGFALLRIDTLRVSR